MAKIPDEFVPLYVHYRRDRDIRRAGAYAELLYLRALAHAKAVDSAGRIEDYDLDTIGQGIPDVHQVADKLAAERLWMVDGDGWLIRSWEKWNPGGSSEAGMYGNHVRWHEGRGIVVADCPHCPEEPDDIAGDIAPDDRPESPPIIAPESSPDRRVEESREEKRRTKSGFADANPRTDVIEILDHLDAALAANGFTKPNRTKHNLDAARLLIDRDGRTVDQIKACIDFATQDEFWRPNIRSMSKLRDKYEQLRAKAAGNRGSNVHQLPVKPSRTPVPGVDYEEAPFTPLLDMLTEES